MVEIFCIVISIVGSVASIYSVYHLYSSRNVKSWRSACMGVNKVNRQIRERSFEPDLIIGLGVGGSVFAGLIAGSLGRKQVVVIDRRYEWVHGERKVFIDILKNLEFNYPPQKVLLVTGEIYDAVSLKTAKKYLLTQIECELQTAAMYVWENSDFFPDYYAYRIEKRIVPPWRLKGSVRDSKIDKSLTVAEI